MGKGPNQPPDQPIEQFAVQPLTLALTGDSRSTVSQERSTSAPAHVRPADRGNDQDSAALDQDFAAIDQGFVALVDGHFADAARRSGAHLLCRPGCSQCCVGIFAIGPADVLRAREGMADLAVIDPDRAARVQARAIDSWKLLQPEFPGDPITGLLALDSQGELPHAFEAFADHEPCPALDPSSGTCDIYAARPLTCRVFGPPIRVEGGYGVCELCFTGATPSEIATAALEAIPVSAEAAVDRAAIAVGVGPGSSILAFVLANPV